MVESIWELAKENLLVVPKMSSGWGVEVRVGGADDLVWERWGIH